MKLWSKIGLLFSAIVILVACGNGEESGSSKKDGKTKIEYWHVNAETQGGQTVAELVEEFNAQSDTVEVVAKYNPDLYKGLMQNLQAEVAAGSTPAIVQIGWAFLDYFSNNFSYVTPQEVINAHFEEDKTFLEDNFLSNIMDLAKNSEGSQVGIPYSLSTPVLYINRDLLNEAGLPTTGPTTWEQLKEYAKVILDKTGKYGFYMQEPADNWATQALLESNGAKIMTDGKASFASEKGIKAYSLLRDMVVEDKTALHIGWDQGIQSFIDGNVAMLYTTIAQRSNIQNNAQFDVAAIKSPTWEGKEVKLPAGGAMLTITAQEEQQQKAAWEFMKFLYSVESVAKWTKGTGYVPAREGVADAENGLKPFLAENEMMKAAIDQMSGVVPWTSFPGDAGLQAEQLLLDVRDQILSGSVSVEEGLTSTEHAINELLK
ncbi:ABC transporter substrate-binding protein [Lysinibacillus sphaericus]|uniref:ABC transporter substrate-binding protein n=1 Tax=Lysinibacillus sphaericus TaxID=1421 RepID=A0A2S0K1X4_LYSSH|nr:ABC transporter substrate-binding protein [Lysinibacillus sphaericus]AVK97309.1 ABC transporter substrate-binding protein [Lysinibacillus sphaericus]MED4542613.1 ABC transporter substrate-binding protein [Lysinibacillus sphaericus]TKI20003.1 ABC transporter substrate-binding protein [Lysinibacillus sphaericus]SUV16797.1 glycerol-3-phosphate ABC transporter substrate-binding protein [Lysinibacillus sphaericus]GEC80400.1 ABC transporter substrate-binding protein [Lysinibacillus sphaericus]